MRRPASPSPLEIHHRGAVAHNLSDFLKVAFDIGDQSRAVQKKGQETIIEIAPFYDVTLLAACDNVRGKILPALVKRNNIVLNFRVESSPKKRKPPAAVCAEFGGDIRPRTERLNLSHQPRQ